MKKKEKLELVKQLKSRPCADCGETFDPVCMDFDHRNDEEKSGYVGEFISNDEKFLAEIAKCDVVCACCHRLRTSHRGMTKKTREAQRAAFARPEIKAKISAKSKEINSRPEVIEQKSLTMKAYWAAKKAVTQ